MEIHVKISSIPIFSLFQVSVKILPFTLI